MRARVRKALFIDSLAQLITNKSAFVSKKERKTSGRPWNSLNHLPLFVAKKKKLMK